MNRGLTNFIRNLIDNYLPPVIRDSKFFMYPIFFYWFKGEKVELFMDFKERILDISSEEFNDIYRNLNCRAKDRKTDLNDESIKYIQENIDQNSGRLIDIGCGNGYLLSLIENKNEKFGCDVFDNHNSNSFKYIKGNIENLPFEDSSFDTVICSHTLEHIPDLKNAVKELKRIASKQLIVVVPRQRYFYYTLDLHLHFFPDRFSIINQMGLEKYSLVEKDGDWVYIGYKE